MEEPSAAEFLDDYGKKRRVSPEYLKSGTYTKEPRKQHVSSVETPKERPSLDDILDEFIARYKDALNGRDEETHDRAKAQISALIDQVIGADDRLQTREPSMELEVERNRVVVVRNSLRAEQRKRKEELLG